MPAMSHGDEFLIGMINYSAGINHRGHSEDKTQQKRFSSSTLRALLSGLWSLVFGYLFLLSSVSSVVNSGSQLTRRRAST